MSPKKLIGGFLTSLGLALCLGAITSGPAASQYNLSEGGNMSITLTLSPGWRWKVGAVADDKTVDFNLVVRDSAGNLVVKDIGPEADAYVTLDATGDAKYTLRVKSVRGSGTYSLDVQPVGQTANLPPLGDTSSQDTSSQETSSQDTSSASGSSGAGEILKASLTDSEKQAILQSHNEWRSRYGVGALTWSDTLASDAQAWADELANRGFQLEHSPRPPRTAGENLAYAGNTDLNSRANDLTASGVVDLWGNEVNDYDYAANTCAPGKVCGHYTQVVWSNSQQVGCGMAKGMVEDANGNQSVQEVWVCQYDPPGNFVGEKPY